MSSVEITKLIEKSGDIETCNKVLHSTKELLDGADIKMMEAQWLSLVSHISAMVNRSITKEPISPIDSGMFSEVSNESIELAAKICGMLPNLIEDEKYLLSIHFESAKINGN